MTRSYSEIIEIPTFSERIKYLQLYSGVGIDTFGATRFLNQEFYRSREWKHARREVILRDDGMDLAHPHYPIFGAIRIHHMNPVTLEQIEYGDPDLFNPEFLISCSLKTHNAIHYGDEDYIPDSAWEPRSKWDTVPWR